MPNIQINFLAIAIAVISQFILGFIWYTPLFGKIWAKEMGMNTDQKAPAGTLIRGMIMNVIGNFLFAWVFCHNLQVWRPETWGLPSIPEMTPMGMAFAGAFFTWLGFFVPTDLNTVAWEGRSWKFFFINTVYHLLSCILVAVILNGMS